MAKVGEYEEELKKEDISKIYTDLSKDPSGNAKFTYNEFVKIIDSKSAEHSIKDEIIRAFKLFDKSNTNKISYNNLKCVLEEIGEYISKEEIVEMI